PPFFILANLQPSQQTTEHWALILRGLFVSYLLDMISNFVIKIAFHRKMSFIFNLVAPIANSIFYRFVLVSALFDSQKIHPAPQARQQDASAPAVKVEVGFKYQLVFDG